MGGVKRGGDRDDAGTPSSSLVTENTSSVLGWGERWIREMRERSDLEAWGGGALRAHHRLSSMSWQLGSVLCILSPSLRIRYSRVTPNCTQRGGGGSFRGFVDNKVDLLGAHWDD